MNITLVAGSLEPGRDGVGDYTRWLANAAARRGAACRVLALADRHVCDPVRTRDASGGECLRLPFGIPWSARLQAASEFVRASRADWVSLQFVPYSFQKRGFASAVVRSIPDLVGRARLHVMFHEIWIDGTISWRKRLVSTAQRGSILQLCRYPGAVIHTTNGTYRDVLADHGVRADVLPLFGSIPIAQADATRWLAPLLSAAGCDALPDRRGEWWLFVLFGTLHPVWPPLPLLSELQASAAEAGKRLALISVGRLGSGEALWAQMSATYAPRVPMLRLGEQPPERISEVLQAVDFGVATTPLALIGKSATAAAMFDHGLPVVVNREDCCWPPPQTTDPREAALVIRRGPGFGERLRLARRLPPEWRLPEVATQWLADLSNAEVPLS